MTPEMTNFLDQAGWSGAASEPIAQDSSARRYLRLARSGDSAVLMIAPPEETAAFHKFITIADWLRSVTLSAPEILAEDAPSGLMLIEDFGIGVMAELAAEDPELETQLYHETGRVLDHLAAVAAPPGLPVLGGEALVEQTGLIFDEMPDRDAAQTLRPAWMAGLAAQLSPRLASATVPALRDLHAENVMWLPDRKGIARVGLLDFQDAVMAPPGYDLASLVDDPRRAVPKALRDALILDHANANGCDPDALRHQVDLLSLARNLRILGIFRRAARLRDRAAYLDFLPQTARLIRQAAPVAGAFQPQIDRVLAEYGLAEVAAL